MKKGFTLIEMVAVVAILGLIVLIVYPAVNSMIRSARENAYNSQVAIIIKAAKEWGVDNASLLPEAGSDEKIYIYLTKQSDPNAYTLNGYLTNDDIVDPRDRNKNLEGYVEVEFASNQYVYTYIDEPLTTNNLGNNIMNTQSVLKAGSGIYKGSNANNYLEINDELWRIMSVNNDGSVKIIKNDSIGNLAFDENSGINFENSTLYNYLNNNYYNTLKDLNLEKGNYGGVSSYVGIMSLSDYASASNDVNCTTGLEDACANGNYLAAYSMNNGSEYTLTSNGNNIDIISKGLVTNGASNVQLGVRPIIVLSSSMSINGGSGTSMDPYTLTEN